MRCLPPLLLVAALVTPACDDGTDNGGGDVACVSLRCASEPPATPQDLTPSFDTIADQCTGVFVGHGDAQAGGAVVCRYDGVEYRLEIAMQGAPECALQPTIDDPEQAADCSDATKGEVTLVGELVAGETTYRVTGKGRAYVEFDEVGESCSYIVEDPTPGELPALEESGGEIGLGVTYAQWRHEDFDQVETPDWEYCRFVLDEHTPPPV